jgi:hypothetical protein
MTCEGNTPPFQGSHPFPSPLIECPLGRACQPQCHIIISSRRLKPYQAAASCTHRHTVLSSPLSHESAHNHPQGVVPTASSCQKMHLPLIPHPYYHTTSTAPATHTVTTCHTPDVPDRSCLAEPIIHQLDACLSLHSPQQTGWQSTLQQCDVASNTLCCPHKRPIAVLIMPHLFKQNHWREVCQHDLSTHFSKLRHHQRRCAPSLDRLSTCSNMIALNPSMPQFDI